MNDTHGEACEPANRVVKIGSQRLVCGDALAELANLPDLSFDLAVVDPPYNASTKATWNLPAGHQLKGFGGAWKLASHEWDRFPRGDYLEFTIRWLSQVKRLVRPTGSIWIHATYHNAGFVNVALQMLGIEIINEVVWYKRNAFPNLAGRRLTASHETIYWAHTGNGKREYRFNYDKVKMATFPGDTLKLAGKQLRTVWDIPNNKQREEIQHGGHPTQKPLRLLERMFMISGCEGWDVLDPFMGRGTTEVAALRFGMSAYGIEIDQQHFEVSCRRLNDEREKKTQMTFDSGTNLSTINHD